MVTLSQYCELVNTRLLCNIPSTYFPAFSSRDQKGAAKWGVYVGLTAMPTTRLQFSANARVVHPGQLELVASTAKCDINQPDMQIILHI